MARDNSKSGGENIQSEEAEALNQRQKIFSY